MGARAAGGEDPRSGRLSRAVRERVGFEEQSERIRRQFAAAPAGLPVRLAKTTSNLFRERRRASPLRLDVVGFDGVLSVDPVARTADVGGMTTYEHLVDATLPHGLMPLVVPQLKTITLGGAVSGLGIESSSFRNGLPHESVIELEVLTGDGRVVARPFRQRAPRPVLRLPQLLRHAGLCAAADDRARARAPVRTAAPPALR